SVSLAHLKNLESEVKTIDPDRTVLRYYNAVGNLALASGDLPAAQAAFESSIAVSHHEKASPSEAGDKALLDQESGVPYRKLADILLSQGRSQEALGVWEAYRGSEWARPAGESGQGLNIARNSIGVPDVHALLPKLGNHTFLSLMRTHDGLNIWVLD